MLNIFKKKRVEPSALPLTVDIHSHLLPGIDDGVKDWEESMDILRAFVSLGYEKVVTTPHIFMDHYPNSPEIILSKLRELKERVKEAEIPIEVGAAAEYYLDEHLLKRLENNEKVLTFGDNFLLFETSFINKPTFLVEAIFQISSSGYRPVMAHPERYNYLVQDESLLETLLERQVLLQININSLTGYYSKAAKKFAEMLIDKGLVSFIGTDCHNRRHLEVIREATTTKYFRKAAKTRLLNSNL